MGERIGDSSGVQKGIGIGRFRDPEKIAKPAILSPPAKKYRLLSFLIACSLLGLLVPTAAALETLSFQSAKAAWASASRASQLRKAWTCGST